MLELTPGELIDRLSLIDDPFEGEPLVTIAGALDGDFDRMLEAVPAVVIGYDVMPEHESDLAAVERTVAAHPEASIALAVLLRGSEARSIGDGLAAESAVYATLQGGSDHGHWLAGRPPSPAPAFDTPVLARRSADGLEIVLNRPDRHNAYSAAMRDSLMEALLPAVADSDLRVTLSGAGPSFCSGGDLAEFGTAVDPAVAHLTRLRRSPARVLASISERVHTRIHGACAGAGIELPAFTGRVTASPGTRIWLPEIPMGLVPGAGGTVSLPRRIGRRRTALLALTGKEIDESIALEWGLVDGVDHG